MLKLERGMDHHSRTIYRDNKSIGFLQWHPNKDSLVILWGENNHLTIKEMKYLIDQFDSIVTNPTMEVGQ